MADFPTPQQIKQVQSGHAASSILVLVQAETDAMERAVITRALQDLHARRLTPEAALEAWRELSATRRLLKSFQTRATIGQNVAAEIGSELDPQKE